MSIVNCTGCDATAEGKLVRYMAPTKRGPVPRTSLQPPDDWGVRSLDGGQTTSMFCADCRGKLSRGEMKVGS